MKKFPGAESAPEVADSPKTRTVVNGVLWRKNILTLFGYGYLILFAWFLGCISIGDVPVKDAMEMLMDPLEILLIGSVACAKDLL